MLYFVRLIPVYLLKDKLKGRPTNTILQNIVSELTWIYYFIKKLKTEHLIWTTYIFRLNNILILDALPIPVSPSKE